MAFEPYLMLTFNTNSGKTASIKIPSAKPTITGTEVASAMNKLITTNAIKTTAGDLASKEAAELYVYSITEFNVKV